MQPIIKDMAMMNPNGGPQWANPSGTSGAPVDVSEQESEFFAPLSTLDEPVRETIMRDVRSVASKLRVVLLPMDRSVSSDMSCLRSFSIGIEPGPVVVVPKLTFFVAVRSYRMGATQAFLNLKM